MRFLWPTLALILFLIGAFPSFSIADRVTPTERVTRRVIVREQATTTSSDVGSLRPGDSAELISSIPGWHLVRLTDGTEGFVSKAWTRIIPGTPIAFTIDVVDVGTGLALFVSGEDFHLLYDGGSNDDLARGEANRLVRYLRQAAPDLTVVDHVILSHPHRDHVELLPDVLETYDVRNAWDSGALNPICGYRAFLTAIAEEPEIAYHSAVQDFGTRTVSFEEKRCYGVDLPPESIAIPHSSRIPNTPIPLGLAASMTFLYADGSAHGGFNENSLVVRLDLSGTAPGERDMEPIRRP